MYLDLGIRGKLIICVHYIYIYIYIFGKVINGEKQNNRCIISISK